MVYELANTPQLHLIDRGYIVVRQEPTDSFGDQKMAEMENVPPQEALGNFSIGGRGPSKISDVLKHAFCSSRGTDL